MGGFLDEAGQHPMAQIAADPEMGPEAVGLISSLLDHSAREREFIENQIIEGKDQEIERWKTRALEAEAHVDQITRRLLALVKFDIAEHEWGDGP